MQYPGRTGPIQNDPAPFSPEMVQGWHPDSPRTFLAPRIPQPLAQTTHTPAPFSVEMSAGWHPDQPKNWQFRPLGWSDTQLTHVPTPFSVEMSAGWQPPTQRPFLFIRTGWSDSQLTPVAAPFSVEMSAGYHPDSPRTWLAPRINLPVPPVDIPSFSIEMVAGWHPDQPRQFLAPRIPLPLSETSPTAAPFSIDMVAGSHPDQPRQPQLGRQVWLTNLLDVPIFSIEMVQGSQPERSNLFRTLRTFWTTISQVFVPDLVITVRNFQGKTSTQTIDKIPFLYVTGPAVYTFVNIPASSTLILTPGAHQGLYIREKEANLAPVDGNVWFRWEEDQPLAPGTNPFDTGAFDVPGFDSREGPTTYKAGVF